MSLATLHADSGTTGVEVRRASRAEKVTNLWDNSDVSNLKGDPFFDNPVLFHKKELRAHRHQIEGVLAMAAAQWEGGAKSVPALILIILSNGFTSFNPIL